MSAIDRRDFASMFGGTALALAAGDLSLDDRKPRRERIKIGQIGVGHGHAANKLSVHRQSADYEVIGVVEPDAVLRQRAATLPAYKDLPWMTREQLLNVRGLQAVLVETRVRDLIENAEACIAAGLHVHIDKPPGESLVQLQRLLSAAAKKGLFVQVGYMYRYNPAVILLREFLAKGWLGEPFEAHAVMSKAVPAEARRELATYPGGIMFELGCHVIDLIVGLMGPPREVHAFGLHSAPLDDKLSDNMLAVFGYPRATVTVKSSALEVEGFERRHLVVCGSEGTFHIQPLDNPSARVALASPRGAYKKGWQDVHFEKYERHVADAAEMAKVIRGEKKADYLPEHDLAVQETLMKACGLQLQR